MAFDRGGAIAVATRLPVGLERIGGWRDTTLDVGGEVTDVILRTALRRHDRAGDLLDPYPVALLVALTRAQSGGASRRFSSSTSSSVSG